MTRGYLTTYLTTQDCAPVPEFDFPGIGQMWKNEISGDVCFVPYEDDLALTTYCHIFYELKVDPPQDRGYDSDYAVYTSFRDFQLKKIMETKSMGEGENLN